MGKCDDHTIKQLQVFIEPMSDDDVKSLADILMTNLVKYPDDIDVLTGSIKALEVLPFMPKAKNEFIITLLLSLLKAPVNKKDALQRKVLKSEVVKFMLFFVVEDDSYARLMMPELISAMDETHTISSSVFHALRRLAVEKPEYFERYSAALIKQLGSINKTTRAEAAKLIGLIAKTHPEYVCRAMPFLQSLASFYPDAHVKRNANEAYQIIWQSIKVEPEIPVSVGKADDDGKGFANIVKLNVGASNDSMAEVQFTDDELKEIIDLTRKEFKNDAESILHSLGVGHLTVNSKESRKKAPQPKAAASPEPAPAPAKPKKEEKAEITPHPGIMSVMKREAKEQEAHKASRQKAVSPPAPAPVPLRSKKDDKTFVTPQSGIADAIMRDLNEPVIANKPIKSRGDPKAGRTFKCPRCGKHVWAEGQLCNSCGADDYDSMTVKGHYDINSK